MPFTRERDKPVEAARVAVNPQEASCQNAAIKERAQFALHEPRYLAAALPGIPIGAYTATATEHVRRDIAGQLNLDRPRILVGNFDLPNLVYRVRRRLNLQKQIDDVLARHRGQPGIIYCIRRADVDQLSGELCKRGYRAGPYHAGTTDEERRKSQNAFIEDRLDLIVATVAFGMGIDKPDVRFVIHAGMPKSLEHYQQESGRAGRDGLDAECLLLYSGADYLAWKRILEQSEPQAYDIAAAKLSRMYRYCGGAGCRHRKILNYFGQDLDKENCRACDICLGEIEGVPDALTIAQKILSCVIRQGERFGAEYTAGVLTASREDRILLNRHNELSTYGILKEARSAVRDWIEQLVDQECLARVGEFGVLKLTDKGRLVLKGKEHPLLLEPVKKKAAPKPRVMKDSREGANQGLFDELRRVRRELAQDRRLPAYIVFSDASLLDMARKRPSTLSGLLRVFGVGEKKLEQYGEIMLHTIRRYCLERSLEMDEG